MQVLGHAFFQHPETQANVGPILWREMPEHFLKTLRCALLDFVKAGSAPKVQIFRRPCRGFVNIMCIHADHIP